MDTQNQLRSASRRRLAKGALATPAVLASLTSKNALAGSYHCGISGNMSGNLSKHQHETQTCQTGNSCSHWKAFYASNTGVFCPDWLGPLKGKTVKPSRGNPGGPMRADNRRTSRDGWGPATRHHVLSGSDDRDYPVRDVELVRAALCAYANAELFPDYHVSPQDCKDLYRAASTGGSLTRNGKTWYASDCRHHLVNVLFF